MHWIRRTIDDYQGEFKEKGIALDFQPASTELYVEADPARITQVVGNLLHNAVKFTDAGGYTRMSVAEDDLQQFAVIRVEDSGIGMSPEMLENVFTPFMQADTSLDRNGTGGLGLGLALVKGLTELHGGAVSAQSDGLGKGSVFTVTIPLSVKPLSISAAEAATRPYLTAYGECW
jgi:signal transduction histidine kinase